LAALMGGQAWAESTLGSGSTLHCTIRVGIASAPAALPVPATAAAKILIIDDKHASGDALREILASQTAAVELIASGQAGLSRAAAAIAEGHPFDVILLDSRMPACDSFTIAQGLQRLPSTAGKVVMMLTADDLNLHLARMRELGLARYLIKPIRRAELLNAISPPQQQLAGEAPVAALVPMPTNGKPSTAVTDERPLRILLTDDSLDNRMLIKAYFKRLPYQIDEAENGAVALAKFTAGSYDIVLMDLQMPVMDGLSAIRGLRDYESSHQLTRTPIIALTASALDEDMHKSLDAGADAHVSKPVTKASLLEAIHNAINASAIHLAASSHAA
jgi:two-component system, sensor histidine kinase and response regulator